MGFRETSVAVMVTMMSVEDLRYLRYGCLIMHPSWEGDHGVNYFHSKLSNQFFELPISIYLSGPDHPGTSLGRRSYSHSQKSHHTPR